MRIGFLVSHCFFADYSARLRPRDSVPLVLVEKNVYRIN